MYARGVNGAIDIAATQRVPGLQLSVPLRGRLHCRPRRRTLGGTPCSCDFSRLNCLSPKKGGFDKPPSQSQARACI